MACSLSVRLNLSATPLVSGSQTKAKLGWMPPKRIWFKKWSDRYWVPLGSMIHAERKSTRHASLDAAIDIRESHRNRLESRIAVAVLDDVPPDALGAPVLDRGEQPDVTVIDCEDLGSIGAPHHMGGLGDDGSGV